jgi:hypothetical protein
VPRPGTITGMDDERTVLLQRGAGRKTQELAVRIPSDDILVAAALELKNHSAGIRGTYGTYSATCVGRYFPPREMSATEVNPFTGDQGETIKSMLPEDCTFFHFDGQLTAVALVAFTEPPAVRLLCKLVTEEQLALFAPSSAVEGAPRRVEQTRYERDPALRAACLALQGTGCSICGMTFEGLYGAEAAGFIHVHHLDPLGTVGQAHVVDPATDLIPVCPNCHGVIHLRSPPFTPDEMKAMLARSQSDL